jgi:Tfp pilus assembly protein FimT
VAEDPLSLVTGLFSLIELVVVPAIVVILVASAFPLISKCAQ